MNEHKQEEPNRYFMSGPQRRALWENEIAMFVVLAMPLVIAAFWYGWTLQTIDIYGDITVPYTFSRGVGVALMTLIVAAVAGAIYLYIQPAAVRIQNGQPIRGARRLSFAAFVGFLVAINTAQSLIDASMQDQTTAAALGLLLGLVVATVAYVSMRSMVDIPFDPRVVPVDYDARVRGAR